MLVITNKNSALAIRDRPLWNVEAARGIVEDVRLDPGGGGEWSKEALMAYAMKNQEMGTFNQMGGRWCISDNLL